jgi:hypothetical protein
MQHGGSLGTCDHVRSDGKGYDRRAFSENGFAKQFEGGGRSRDSLRLFEWSCQFYFNILSLGSA